MIQLIERATEFSVRQAIKISEEVFSYKDLLEASEKGAQFLLRGAEDLNEARIAFLIPPGFDYVRIQWAIWRSGGIAVPLCDKHPLPSIQYVLEDAEAAMVIYAEEYKNLLEPILHNDNYQFIELSNFEGEKGVLPDIDPERRAMILYTSGTTGNPKGVVSTHANIEAQIKALVELWQWNQDDHILNILPLHHVHGIINVLSCALWSGACCEFLPKFDEARIFTTFNEGKVNIFMAVPTIYYKLINYWKALPNDEQQNISAALKKFRLMVSGSAALPVSVLNQWKEISGHILLERYGMTEMGMAISNPYVGERKPGFIGLPIPGVKVRLVDEDNKFVAQKVPGEIQVKGANIFKEYWKKPEATAESFTTDGWFKTGDVAIFEEGSYKIIGRNSVDIIKSGGYKISALEIEEVLRTHPLIKDCGVVGIPDEEWGEIIAAGLVCEDDQMDIEALTNWVKERLPGYKTPRKYHLMDDLPRNVMGKVTKNELKTLFK